jgi:transcriptional regulator with GAF, ATPase, and Fis domain
MEMEQTADEIKRLQGCINNLISLLALPAIWSGQEPAHILDTLLGALVRMLRLDFVYARLNDPIDRSPIEVVRLAQRRNPAPLPQQMGRALNPWLTGDPPQARLVIPNPIGKGEVSVAPLRLGLADEVGVLVPGSERTDFPSQIEMLLLRVAANQTAIGLQEARDITERKRAAEELEKRVDERTRQLTEVNEELRQAKVTLEKAFDEIKTLKDRLYHENVALREEIDRTSMFEEIVGSSRAMRAVLSRVAKVAPTDSTVLITGETGTGKELIARAIHKRSKRAARAFVAFNCAGVPSSLVASELFGHEKGAFTGAQQRRLGRFEVAEGGTIFLDEVGELPAETQIALLRVLQEREFERVGDSRPISADVRIIAATNRNLEDAVAAGTFRLDLFYRLNVFPIEVPPLRERREDIPMLLEYFIKRYADKAGKTIQSVDKKTVERFKSYSWPGNIRELQNVIERSVIVCESEVFSVEETWLSKASSLEPHRPSSTLSEMLLEQEKRIIESALSESKGKIAGPYGAATRLGIPSSTLESKIKTLKIKKNRFKSD